MQEDIEHLPGETESGLVDRHLLILGIDETLPADSVEFCLANLALAGPPLRALLARAAEGEHLDLDEETLLFRGLHILGAARDPETFQPLLRFLQLPEKRIDHLLGDATTETLPSIVAGVFNGDTDALLGAAADCARIATVRGALLRAAAFLTWEGRIEREPMIRFLQETFDRRGPAQEEEDEDDFWFHWQEAVSSLALRDLAPLVQTVFEEERLMLYLDPEDFEADLAAAEQAGDDGERWEQARPIEDVVQCLSRFGGSGTPDDDEFDDDEEDEEDWLPRADEDWARAKPTPQPVVTVVNPYRDVGRNDPCPCGSGKKFKKCCLRTAKAG